MKLPHLTFGKILAGSAIVLIATTGTAYAAATITGADIVDNSVASIDIQNGQIRTADILDSGITGIDLLDGTVKSADIGDNSVTAADVLDGTLKQADLATGSVSTAEVLDFGLSNQDVGVLYAVVEDTGVLAGSSGGVVASRFDTGVYVVDFNRPVFDCALTATHGTSGSLLTVDPTEAVAHVSDHPTLEDTVVVDMAGLNGAPVDATFHLTVVC